MVLFPAAIFFRSFFRNVDRYIRNVNAGVIKIAMCGQFDPRIAQATSEVQDASAMTISFKEGVDTISVRPCEVIPSASGKFRVPYKSLDPRGSILQKKSTHPFLDSLWKI